MEVKKTLSTYLEVIRRKNRSIRVAAITGIVTLFKNLAKFGFKGARI